jgi:hypothetical protein
MAKMFESDSKPVHGVAYIKVNRCSKCPYRAGCAPFSDISNKERNYMLYHRDYRDKILTTCPNKAPSK